MHFRSSGEDLICTLRYIIWSFMQLNFGLYFYQNMFIDLRTRANQFMSLLFIKRAVAFLAMLSKRFRFIDDASHWDTNFNGVTHAHRVLVAGLSVRSEIAQPLHHQILLVQSSLPITIGEKCFLSKVAPFQYPACGGKIFYCKLCQIKKAINNNPPPRK